MVWGLSYILGSISSYSFSHDLDFDFRFVKLLGTMCASISLTSDSSWSGLETVVSENTILMLMSTTALHEITIVQKAVKIIIQNDRHNIESQSYHHEVNYLQQESSLFG